MTANLDRLLKTGELDAAILALPYEAPGIEVEPLYDEEFQVVVPQGHPFARRRAIPVDELDAGELLLLPVGHCLRDQVLGACTEFSRPPPPGPLGQLARDAAQHGGVRARHHGVADDGADGSLRHAARESRAVRGAAAEAARRRRVAQDDEARRGRTPCASSSKRSGASTCPSSYSAARNSRSARAASRVSRPGERHGLARHGRGLRVVAGLQLELAELEPQHGVVRVEPQRALERRARGRQAARGALRAALLEQCAARAARIALRARGAARRRCAAARARSAAGAASRAAAAAQARASTAFPRSAARARGAGVVGAGRGGAPPRRRARRGECQIARAARRARAAARIVRIIARGRRAKSGRARRSRFRRCSRTRADSSRYPARERRSRRGSARPSGRRSGSRSTARRRPRAAARCRSSLRATTSTPAQILAAPVEPVRPIGRLSSAPSHVTIK